jgi:molecular chaperone DnaJ
LGGHGEGDLIITVVVETPAQVNAEQRKLFESLSKFDRDYSHPMARGFFDKVRNLFQ